MIEHVEIIRTPINLTLINEIRKSIVHGFNGEGLVSGYLKFQVRNFKYFIFFTKFIFLKNKETQKFN